MVSFQPHPLSPNHKRSIGDEESENSCNNKRKWDDPFPFLELEKRSKSTNDHIMMRPKSLFDVELQLEAPLPYEWQRCLDIQSGQIHFYNTRTHMKTSRDPRRSGTTTPEPPISSNHHHEMSLDLELMNLRCDSQPPHHNNNQAEISPKSFRELFKSNASKLGMLQQVEQDQEEMVATVCLRCHMLVILCKSSPSCPNCRYMHSSDHQSTSTPFKSMAQGGHVASSCSSQIKAAWYN